MNIKTNNTDRSKLAINGLYDVIDPEIGLNIIDLGLIYEIDFNDSSSEITVNMTLTTQFCPMGESIVAATMQAMQQSFPKESIQVNLIFEPAWNQSMITEDGQIFLNS